MSFLKKECRRSLKSLENITIIRGSTTLCQCTCSSQSNTNPCHYPGHPLFQLICRKNKLI